MRESLQGQPTLPDVMRSLQEVADASETAWTVLHAAVAIGHVEATRFLLASGMPVDATDAQGDTALHVCAQAGHEAAAEIILAAGASVAVRGAFDHTPYHRAELMGHHRLARRLHAVERAGGLRRGWLRRCLRWPWRAR